MLRGLSTNLRNKRSIAYAIIASAAFSFIALFLAPTFLPSSSFADEPITVNPSITIGNSGVLSLAVNPGQFASSSQNVVVTTSNYTGYTMTIAPSSGSNTDLEHTAVTNLTIPSVSEETTSSELSSLNTAAYGLSIDDGANYLPVISGSTIKSTSAATDTTTGHFSFTLGAKTLTDTPAGTYTKTFILTATANPASWSITYNKNTDDTVTNMPNSNEATVSGTTVTISGKTPARDGYNFLGWAETADAATATIQPSGTFTIDPETANSKTYYAVWQQQIVTIVYDANGGDGEMPEATYKYENKKDGDTFDLLYASNYSKTGYGFAGFSTDPNAGSKLVDSTVIDKPTIYGPNETITLPDGFSALADSNNKVKLYAVWVPAAKNNINQPVYLQGWLGCANMSTGDVTALTDIRDNQVYAIAKLADGNCWMIENLRLDLATVNLTSANTNNPTASFLTAAGEHPASSTTAFNTDGYSVIQYNTDNIDRSLTASYNADDSSWFSYGVRYNWYTATVGYGGFSKRGVVAGDICPSNWRLPTGDGSEHNELVTLNDSVNSGLTNSSAGLRKFPVNYVYAGDVFRGREQNISQERGSTGSYWSSSAGTNSNAGTLLIEIANYGERADPQSTTGKYYGNYVRCIISTPLMQNVNSWGSNVAEGEEIVAIDSRDGKEYTVARIGGQLWMTEDLKITGTIPSNGSNFSGSSFNVSQYDLTDSTNCTGQDASASNPKGFTKVCSHSGEDLNGELTVWYNFAAASAGTVTGYNNSNQPTGDICPSYWSLPTGEQGSLLVNVLNSNSTLKTTFSPNNGWFYYNGSVFPDDSLGAWWTSETYSGSGLGRYNINYYSNDGSMMWALDYPGIERNSGIRIRCVAPIRHSLTVTVDSHVTGLTLKQGSPSGTTINGTVSGNVYTFVNLVEGSRYYLYPTFDSEYGFDSWTETVVNYRPQLDSPSTENTYYTVGNHDGALTLASDLIVISFDTAYAAAGKSTLINRYTMQDMNASICDAVSVGETGELIDVRDRSLYTVAKLADGKCWMTKNLRLAFTNLVEDISALNTNNPASGFISEASLYPVSFDEGFDSSLYRDYIMYNTDNIDSIATDSNGDAYDDYGVYYNWYTATAGHGVRSKVLGFNGDTSGDICPYGWHLPSGETNYQTGDFSLLEAAVENEGASLIDSPADFVYSGRYDDSSAADRGVSGRYWGSTPGGITLPSTGGISVAYAYQMFLDSSSVSIHPGTPRGVGLAVRCVATIPRTITISLGTGVNSVIIDDVVYHNNDTLTLTDNTTHEIDMTLDTGYGFDSWSVSSGAIYNSASQFTLFTVGSNATLIASATYNPSAAHSLTVSYGTGVSSVTIDNNVVANGSIVDLVEGSSHRIDATFDNGYILNSWSTTSGTIRSVGSGAEDLVMGSSNGTLSVSGISTFELTVSYGRRVTGIMIDNVLVSNGGTISLGGGTQHTISAVFADGSMFKSWTGQNVSIPYPSQDSTYFVMGYDDGAITVSSKTRPSKFIVNISYGPGIEEIMIDREPVDDNSTIKLEAGTEYTIMAYVEPGFVFDSWSSTSGIIDDESSETTSYFVVDNDILSASAVDSSVPSGTHFLQVSYGRGVTGVYVDNSLVGDGDSVNLAEGTAHSIYATLSGGYSFGAWLATSGNVSSVYSQSTVFTMGDSDATLTAIGAPPLPPTNPDTPLSSSGSERLMANISSVSETTDDVTDDLDEQEGNNSDELDKVEEKSVDKSVVEPNITTSGNVGNENVIAVEENNSDVFGLVTVAGAASVFAGSASSAVKKRKARKNS